MKEVVIVGYVRSPFTPAKKGEMAKVRRDELAGPVVEELANDYDGKVKFVKVNVDEANELASKYNVFSIPTLILLNKGEIVSQQVGAASKESYQSMIDRALA